MKTEIFFLRFSILSTREQRFQAPETQVFENGPQSGAFSESPAYRLCEQTRTGFFEYGDVIHDTAHALLVILSFFFVLTFLCGYVLVCVFFCENGEKKNVRLKKYPYTCVRGLSSFSHKASPLS